MDNYNEEIKAYFINKLNNKAKMENSNAENSIFDADIGSAIIRAQ